MTIYTPELGDEICAGLAEGKSLAAVCRELGVEYRDVFKWLRDTEKKEFADNYAHAREAQSHLFAEDVIAISDDPNLQSDDKRVRIDARKWYAGKMQPKKYGDKTLIGSDPENPLPASASTVIVTPDVIRAELLKVRDEF
jgi:hypothetical protein